MLRNVTTLTLQALRDTSIKFILAILNKSSLLLLQEMFEHDKWELIGGFKGLSRMMQGQVAFPVGYIGTMPSFLSYFFWE